MAKLGFGNSGCCGESRTFVVLDFAGKTRNRFLIAKLVCLVWSAGAAGPETPSEWLKGGEKKRVGIGQAWDCGGDVSGFCVVCGNAIGAGKIERFETCVRRHVGKKGKI
jgi:hypothetical protein